MKINVNSLIWAIVVFMAIFYTYNYWEEDALMHRRIIDTCITKGGIPVLNWNGKLLNCEMKNEPK